MINDYNNDSNKRKGNNCNKRDLIDFWKRNCKDLKAVTFQKSGKKHFYIFKVFLVATFKAFLFYYCRYNHYYYYYYYYYYHF